MFILGAIEKLRGASMALVTALLIEKFGCIHSIKDVALFEQHPRLKVYGCSSNHKGHRMSGSPLPLIILLEVRAIQLLRCRL